MSEPFSPEELRLLRSAAYPLLKISASEKLQELLAQTKEELAAALKKMNFVFPEGTDSVTGKISKGENYRRLPWMVLDFPRLFTNESVFAYRTLFWWAHDLSCTLHLQGAALEKHRAQLLSSCESLRGKNVFISVSSDPWEHHFGEDNYRALDGFDTAALENYFRSRNFVKLMRRAGLQRIEHLPAFSTETMRLFFSRI